MCTKRNQIITLSISAILLISFLSFSKTKTFNLEGKYLSYDSKVEPSLNEPHVLFFYADWCSWCRRMKKELTEQISNLPDNTIIYEVNIDNAGKLKKKYGVTTKDSYVFIDRSRNYEKLKKGAQIKDFHNFFNAGTIDMKKNENPTGVGMYRDYDKNIEQSFRGKKPYALFFYADWCSSCRKKDKKLKATLYEMPSGTSVFKVDIDNATDLKKKYGVKTKDTIVFIDKNGNSVDVVANFKMENVRDYFTKKKKS